MFFVLAAGALNACNGVVASAVQSPSKLSVGKAVDSQTGLNTDSYNNTLWIDNNSNLLLGENNLKIQPSLAEGIAESFARKFNSIPVFFGLEYEHDRFVYVFHALTNQTFNYFVGVPIASNELAFFIDAMTGDVINADGCGIGPGTLMQNLSSSVQPIENTTLFQFQGPIVPESGGFIAENFSVKNQTIQAELYSDGNMLYFNVSTPFNWTAVLMSDTPVEEMVSGFKKAVIYERNAGNISIYSINPSHMSVDFQYSNQIQNQINGSNFNFSVPLNLLNLSKGEPFSIMILGGDGNTKGYSSMDSSMPLVSAASSQGSAYASFPMVFWLGSEQKIPITQQYSFPLHLFSNNNFSGSTVNVTAFQWGYNPDTITVRQGDNVTLYLTSNDVTHGFELDAFGVNAVITPGQTTTVNFIANKPGTYTFYCSVFCGSGHPTMRGTLIVIPSGNTMQAGNGNVNFFSFFNVVIMLGFIFATGVLFILIKKSGNR